MSTEFGCFFLSFKTILIFKGAIMSENKIAMVRRVSSKKGNSRKMLVYTQQNSDVTEKLPVPRSACVTKGDTIEFIDGERVYVHCKHGDEKHKSFRPI